MSVGAIEFVFKAKYRNNAMKRCEIGSSAHLFQEEHSWKIAKLAATFGEKNCSGGIEGKYGISRTTWIALFEMCLFIYLNI